MVLKLFFSKACEVVASNKTSFSFVFGWGGWGRCEALACTVYFQKYFGKASHPWPLKKQNSHKTRMFFIDLQWVKRQETGLGVNGWFSQWKVVPSEVSCQRSVFLRILPFPDRFQMLRRPNWTKLVEFEMNLELKGRMKDRDLLMIKEAGGNLFFFKTMFCAYSLGSKCPGFNWAEVLVCVVWSLHCGRWGWNGKYKWLQKRGW